MKARITFLVAAALLSAWGCTEKQKPAEKGPVATLAIGLIPEANIFRQLDRYDPLARYIAKKTGIAVQLRVLPRYGNIISNFEEGKMDGAFFGSFTYVLAHNKLDVDVLARPVRADGTSTYHGLLIVRKGSGIQGVKEMKGKVFAFVDRATTAGYLFPVGYFQENGIRDYRAYFRETYFTGTHEDVVLDVLSRKADAGALKNTVFDRMVAQDPKLKENIVVLARCPDVPENGLAVRKNLAPWMKKALQETLLGMSGDPEGLQALSAMGAVRFIETTDADYQPVVDYAAKVGLDLATYEYQND